MGIESNKEAYQMVKNTLGSIENRFREAYNKGYKDGLRDGASQVTAKLVSKILEETEADTPQTESTGSPIGDYRDGVGAWQTDRMTEEEFDTKLAKVLVGQTDCGWK